MNIIYYEPDKKNTINLTDNVLLQMERNGFVAATSLPPLALPEVRLDLFRGFKLLEEIYGQFKSSSVTSVSGYYGSLLG